MKRGLFLLFCLFGAFQLFGSASASASSSSSSYADCRSGRNLTADDKSLFRAIYFGSMEKVGAALKSVGDLKCVNRNGSTPLRAAIGNYKVGVVEIMLESGKNVSQGDKGNLLDYVRSVINELEDKDRAGNLKRSGKKKLSAFKSIKQLLVDDDKGKDRESRFRSSNTPEADPLTRSASAPSSSSSYADRRSGENLTDDKALLGAIYHGSMERAGAALKSVGDLKFVNRNGSTPLRAAIRNHKAGIVRKMLWSGKDVSEGDKGNLLDYVHNEINKLGNKRRAGNSEKWRKRKLYDLQKIEQMLVDDGRFFYKNTQEADWLTASASSCADCRSGRGLTPGDNALLGATRKGSGKLILKLLGGVDDLKAVGKSGNTLLRNVIGRGDVGIVRIMLKSGKDVSEGDKGNLLDYVRSVISELENKGRVGNSDKWRKNKLSAFKSIKKMLVDDNKGENGASRFRSSNTPEADPLTKYASASVTASASSSSSSSSSSSVPAAATAAAVVEVSSSSSSAAAGRATNKRKESEPDTDPASAADKDASVTGGAQKKRKPSAAAVVDVIAVVPAAEAAVDEENTGEAAAVDSGVGDRDNGMRLTPAELDGLVDSGASANVVYYPLLSDEEYNLFGSDDEGGFLMDEDSW